MEKVQFGRTGLQASRLGFGAAPIGYLNTERAKVRKILNLMLDRGVNVIDTAASYEGSEEMIAEAIGHRRGGFVVLLRGGGGVVGDCGAGGVGGGGEKKSCRCVV